jgi:hypothetical protein
MQLSANLLKAKVTSMTPLRFRSRFALVSLILLILASIPALAETCQTSSDMDEATRSALNSAGQRYFDMIGRGDTAALRQGAIPGLASDFSGIEATVKGHQAALAGAKSTARPPFLLDAPGTAAIPRAEFFCGVFGKSGQTSGSAVFTLNSLPPGKYAVVIFDSASTQDRTAVSLILQQVGNDWKVGGLYIKSLLLTGHDGDWFIARAREYKAKGQLHNAWLYYSAALGLVSPLDFMSTAVSDKLYDDSQSFKPSDFPVDGKTADLSAAGGTYRMTALYPEAVGNDLDLILKYQASNISNTNQTYQSNVAAMKALVAKHPELKDAFAAVVARAVDPSGRDYGTLLAMKDSK